MSSTDATTEAVSGVDGPHQDHQLASSGDWPGWRRSMAAMATLMAVAAVVTYPMVASLGTLLPWSGADALQHLWVMRWYKACLLDGRLPWFCPDVQYPVGVPLGYFSPMHFQALIYIPLSIFTDNDILCYNLIWLSAIVFSGFGTYCLAWYAIRHQGCAMMAGLLAMLSSPIRIHAHGHLELIHVGWFPIFLVCWMRFVDRPGRGRMIGAAVTYVLVAMSAAYFMVFAVFPAALFVVFKVIGEARRREWAGLRGRLRWLIGFVALTLPALLVLFSAHLWAEVHGFELSRPRFEFEQYRAPLWSYFIPLPGYRVAKLLPFHPYEEAGLGIKAGELTSYLGLVTLLLLHRAWFRGARFRESGYLWATLAMLVVLSLGPFVMIGSTEVPMPAGWLWKVFPPIRMTRVPARFNLFVAVIAAVIAGAGLKHLLEQERRRAVRVSIAMALGTLAVVDLSQVPLGTQSMPAMPTAYARVLSEHPDARFLDVPHFHSGGNYLTAIAGYWQSYHLGKTSGGYAGHANETYDNLLTWGSPFKVELLSHPDFLTDPEKVNFELIRHAPFDGYVWLYLTEHGFDHVVLHRWEGAADGHPVKLDRVIDRFRDAVVVDDPDAVVVARDRLPKPDRAVALCAEGWGRRIGWLDHYCCQVSRDARLAVYNPDPDQPLRFAIEAAAFRHRRTVTLRDGETVLARWEIEPDAFDTFLSPPFYLPRGLRHLSLQSDGDDRPTHPRDQVHPPFSLFVSAVSLQPEPVPKQTIALEPGETNLR